MKKILFVVFGGAHKPSTYYRVLQYLNKLNHAEAGFMHKIVSKPQKPAVRKYPHITRGLIYGVQLLKFYALIFYYCALWADKIFIQKTILPKFVVNVFMICKKPFLYDFDDAIYAQFTKSKRTDKEKHKLEALSFILKNAETVIAGNCVLQEYALQFRAYCEIIPTVIDLDRYAVQKNPSTFNFIIGWIGTSQNLIFLERLIAPLRTLRREFPQLKLLVICDKPFEMDDFIINKAWGRDMEIADMRLMDIGIMPLVDDEWTRGKCSFKAIQYMGLGIPTVISPVGMNAAIIKDGVNGYLAEDENEWVEKIRSLLINQDQRLEFCAKSRALVEKDYSLQNWLKRWQQVVSG